jgi:hypothetical protein
VLVVAAEMDSASTALMGSGTARLKGETGPFVRDQGSVAMNRALISNEGGETVETLLAEPSEGVGVGRLQSVREQGQCLS